MYDGYFYFGRVYEQYCAKRGFNAFAKLSTLVSLFSQLFEKTHGLYGSMIR